METTPHPDSAPQGILVVRLGAMGDIVHTLPAVAALCCALPEARIGWVVEERWRELLCARETPLSGARCAGRPLLDTVHVVNTHTWRKALLAQMTRHEALGAFRDIRSAGYRVAVDFQGAMKSALLAQFSGTPVRIGFTHPRERAAALFYTRAFSPEGGHIIEQNVSLAKRMMKARILSVQEQDGRSLRAQVKLDTGFPLPFDPAAEAWCEVQWGDRPFALINPGAGWGAKCWPVERYAEVARALSSEGLTVLANIGPGEEGFHAPESAVIPVTCSVGQLIALCRHARLVIGGDTGPLHLAAALGVPVVGIYGPTDPARNGPVGAPKIVLRHPASATSHRRRRRPDAGLLNISASEVIAAARTLLTEAAR